MSGLKRADELLLRDLKAAVDTHGLDSLSEDDQLVFSLLNDRYDKFLDEGLKKLRGTPTQKRGLLSSIFNRGPQVPSSERRKARMSMAASPGLTSPQVTPSSDAPSGVTNDSMVNGLQMTNGSFFVGNDSMAGAPAAALDAAGGGGGDPVDTTPMSPPRAPAPTVDPTAWFASAVGEQEYLGKHWNWVLPNLVVGAIPFAAPTRDTPGHLSELNEQCQRRQSRITSVISCLGLDEPVGPDGFATAKEWESILSVSTFVHAPIPRERDAVLVHYEDEDSSAGEEAVEEAQPDIEGLPPIRKVTLDTLTLFEDVLAACKHITDKTTDPTTAEISEMVRFKVGGGEKKAGTNTPPQGGGVPTGSFGAAGSFASEGSDSTNQQQSPPLPMPTISPPAEAAGATTTNDDGSGSTTPTVMMGVVVREDSTSPVHQHHDPTQVMQASTTSSIGEASSAVLSGSIVAPPPPTLVNSAFIPPPHLSTGISSDVSSPMRAASPTSMGSPLQSVKRRLGGDQHIARKASVVGPRSVAYLHCKAGCARSYIIATAYLISQHGRTHEEADKFMRCMRTQFNPSENQIAFLKAFEEFVSRPYVRPPSVEEERYQQVLADILSLSPEMRMRLLSDVEKLT